jgi:TPR repeat protein
MPFVVALLLALNVPLPCRNGTLGIEVADVSPAMRRSRAIPDYVAGAFVRVVPPRSPAKEGGLEVGDVIQAVGGELIQNVCDFRKAMAGHGCDEVRLTIRRGTATITLELYLGDATRFEPAKSVDRQSACRNGDGAACTAQAQAYGLPTELLRRACDLGDGNGCYLLALQLGNTKEGAAAYEQACDDGNSLACTNLGFIYERGEGVPKDLREAARLYKLGCRGSSCAAPNNLGCVNLGRFYRDGTGVDVDARRALQLFRDVCERKPVDAEDAGNIARSCSVAGTVMLYGKDVPRDTPRALALLERGCASNDTFGCYNLAVLYDNGEGVPADKTRAAGYYKRACDHDDTEACERLAVLTATQH